MRKHINLSHTCTQSRPVGKTGSILWPKCVTEELNVNNTHTDTHTEKALWHWPWLNKLHLSVAPVEMWGGVKEERERDEEWKGLTAVSVPGCPLRLGLSGGPNCLFPKQQALWLLQLNLVNVAAGFNSVEKMARDESCSPVGWRTYIDWGLWWCIDVLFSSTLWTDVFIERLSLYQCLESRSSQNTMNFDNIFCQPEIIFATHFTSTIWRIYKWNFMLNNNKKWRPGLDFNHQELIQSWKSSKNLQSFAKNRIMKYTIMSRGVIVCHFWSHTAQHTSILLG